MVNTSRLPRPHTRHAWLSLVIVAWGVQALVTQSLLVREALVVMFGSEFAWGVVLFAWLLGVAVGGYAGGVLGPRLKRPDTGLVFTLLLLSIAACAQLWVFRGLRLWLDVAPGELLPLTRTALAALVFVAPVGALVGLAFSVACCVYHTPTNQQPADQRESPASPSTQAGFWSLGNVYALESLGSLLGGVAFSYWAVEHCTPIQTALLCAALTLAACSGFAVAHGGKRTGGYLLAGSAGAAFAAALLYGDALEARLVARRWQSTAPGYRIITTVESKYQNLALAQREDLFTLYGDGHVLTSFPDPYTNVPLAHFFMCQHPAPRQVLLLGGGAEGLLTEILRHPVEHVDYLEPDARKIELIRPHLPEDDQAALEDERVTVHFQDARHYIKTCRDRFDLIIALLPEPLSARDARFFTTEFFAELRQAAKSQAVVGTMIAATPSSLTPEAGRYVASIRATIRPHFPEVTIGWDDPAVLLAATEPGLVSIDPQVLTQRYFDRHVDAPRFHPAWFDGATDWLDPDKLRQRAGELDAVTQFDLSTDLKPSIYLDRLVLWERMTDANSPGMIARLREVGWPTLGTGVAGLIALIFLACYVRDRLRRRTAATSTWPTRAAVITSVATTGFTTMALSIIWLFAFQNLYGYVYQRIGLIVAVFMAGLVLGCGWARGRAERTAGVGPDIARHLGRGLIALEFALALLALAVPFVLPALATLQTSPAALTLIELAVYVLVALTGVLGGAAFAYAGGLQVGAYGAVGEAAGSVVGADHAGACLGALLTGIFLVPVLGTAAAAYFLVALKLVSAGLLIVTRVGRAKAVARV